MSYATAALGSSSYLAGELLQRALVITMQPVPYRGGAPAAQAIASGVVPLGLTDTAPILPMIAILTVTMFIITYVPDIAMYMPRLLKLVD